MISLYTFHAPSHECSYLPGRDARLEYEIVGHLTPGEYEGRMAAGWRRFGHMMFRPRCATCDECRSLRVRVPEFAPNRSQRRNWQQNDGKVVARVGEPRITPAKLKLYDRYHQFMSGHRGWDVRPPKDADDYRESFVANPFPTQEWCYYFGTRLIGVGYADRLPSSMSAIYFYYDPDFRDRGLGVWNVLQLLAYCRRHGVPHLYLGYFVDGCQSLQYKANYAPHDILAGGVWRPV